MGQGASNDGSPQGFQVARVLQGSPAHAAELCPFFDIITAVDGKSLSLERPEFFKEYIRSKKGVDVLFEVFNLRIRAFRDIHLVPNDTWGGAGLLGCSIEWQSAEKALEASWHIVGVHPQSPAALAGLVADRHYILGMQPPEEHAVSLFKDGGGELQLRLQQWRALRSTNATTVDSTLLLLVFDAEVNEVKEALVDMGEGDSFGFDIANGLLHLIATVAAGQAGAALPRITQFYHDSTLPKPIVGPRLTAVTATAVKVEKVEAFPAPPIFLPAPAPTIQSTKPSQPSSTEVRPSVVPMAVPRPPVAPTFPVVNPAVPPTVQVPKAPVVAPPKIPVQQELPRPLAPGPPTIGPLQFPKFPLDPK